MRIGLLYAMEKEAQGYLRRCGAAACEKAAGLSFYELSPQRIVCIGGVGKVNAAMAAQAMIDRCRVELLVNVGCAGALADLPAGTLVVGKECVQHDVDTTLAGDPPGFVSTVERVSFPCARYEETLAFLKRQGYPALSGVIATGDWFGRDYARSAAIRDHYGALVCEMEACAAAQVCLRNAIPFQEFKVVTDHLFARNQDEEYRENFDGALEELHDAVGAYLDWMEE